jgi:hypothetical protein
MPFVFVQLQDFIVHVYLLPTMQRQVAIQLVLINRALQCDTCLCGVFADTLIFQ